MGTDQRLQATSVPSASLEPVDIHVNCQKARRTIRVTPHGPITLLHHDKTSTRALQAIGGEPCRCERLRKEIIEWRKWGRRLPRTDLKQHIPAQQPLWVSDPFPPYHNNDRIPNNLPFTYGEHYYLNKTVLLALYRIGYIIRNVHGRHDAFKLISDTTEDDVRTITFSPTFAATIDPPVCISVKLPLIGKPAVHTFALMPAATTSTKPPGVRGLGVAAAQGS